MSDRPPTCSLSIAVKPEEHAELIRLAAAAGISVAAWMLWAALELAPAATPPTNVCMDCGRRKHPA